MRLWNKMVLCTTSIIAILFSVGGTFTLQKNFDIALHNCVSQYSQQHILERYSLESNITNYVIAGNEFSNERLALSGQNLAGYSQTNPKFVAIYINYGTKVYSNLPSSFSDSKIKTYLETLDNTYIYEEVDNSTYLLLASSINVMDHEFYLVSAYDISEVFVEHHRQIQYFFIMDLFIILISIVTTSILSILLTRPIGKLNKVTKKISSGAYEERISLRSHDEFGDLSLSFNRMAQSIEYKIKALNDDLKVREEFISDFSHELKTPMTSIIGYSDLLRSSPCSMEVQIKSADYIYKESKRLEQLSHSLLRMLSLSDQTPEFSKFPVSVLFQKLQTIMEPSIQPLTLDCNYEDAILYASEELLITLLRNLVENAKKSDPKESSIAIRGQQMEHRYIFSVIDSGIGISPNDIEKITNPFYMVDKSRSRASGGAGLGLSLCKRICELHDTTLHFESTIEVGTTVTFDVEVTDET